MAALSISALNYGYRQAADRSASDLGEAAREIADGARVLDAAVSTREPQGATVPDVQSSYAGAPRPPESIYSPVVLTRDIEKARGWLRDKARGSERIGLVASSNAQRRKQIESLSPTSPHVA
jgi:hypothetical protein